MKNATMTSVLFVLEILTCTCLAMGQDTNKHTAVFNQQWQKALVSIEVNSEKSAAKSIGTGFLIGTPGNHIALVTAKHVVFADEGKGDMIPNLGYRLNNKKGDSVLISDLHADKVAKSSWIRSESHDLACRLIVWGDTTDFLVIPFSFFLPLHQVEPGAPVFIIGFPLGLRSEKYASPIIRRGIVGRKDEANIIVDGFVFPGNSGGPVVYEPSIQLGAGFNTPILQGSWLLGLVVSEISYVEPAISPNTKRARVTFEDNTGLCNVLPSDCILELLKSPDFRALDERK